MTTRPAALVATLGLCGALWLGCGEALETTSPESLPALRVASLDGEELALQRLAADQPLLLWFWAPW